MSTSRTRPKVLMFIHGIRHDDQDRAWAEALDAALRREGTETIEAREYTIVAPSYLDLLEADVPANHLDIGAIAIACALGYLDLRFAADSWRAGRPKLAAWYEAMAARPEIADTAPPGA